VTAHIALHRGDGIARVTVHNEAKLNVLDSVLMRSLVETFSTLTQDETLRAVVLAGAGNRAAIGGADIREMATLNKDTAREFITTLHEVCTAIRMRPVPVVMRLHGYTLGAGLEIAAACDLRLAADTARFGMPEVRIGIPSVIEAALLPMLIGWGRTRRLLLTGETIDAETALRWGLIEEMAPKSELDAAIDCVLTDIIACGPRAIRAQKALIRDWEELTPSAAISRGIDAFSEAWSSDEPRRRMAEFLARRRNG
jgi:enoyl-CoA hydratase/carnithine racemase